MAVVMVDIGIPIEAMLDRELEFGRSRFQRLTLAV
jgi:hypothetical protein